MNTEEIKTQIARLKAVKGNVKVLLKKMKRVHGAAKAAGKIHQWRADEVREMMDKMIKSVDEEVTNLNKRLCEETVTQ